jgi:DnaJ-class molecular chaperone
VDYNLGIVTVLGILLTVAIISTIINHQRKTRLNQDTCAACRGMGFMPTYTSKAIPPCRKCNGTGYVDKN